MYLDGNSYHALLHPQENWVHTMGGEGRPIYLARRTTETRVWLPLARNPQDTMLDDTLSVITHRSILPSFETQPNIVPDLSPWQRKGGGALMPLKRDGAGSEMGKLRLVALRQSHGRKKVLVHVCPTVSHWSCLSSINHQPDVCTPFFFLAF